MSWFRKNRREADAATELYVATVLAAARTLRNRRTDLLVRECERAVELGQSLSLLCLTIRDWEGVAHALGETVAQRTLSELAHVLRGTLRSTDIFLQEEAGHFTLLLPGALAADVPAVTRNLRHAVRSYRMEAPDGAAFFLKLTADIGVASLPQDSVDGDSLHRLALERLAEASQQPDPTGEDDGAPGTPTLRLVA